MVHSSTDRRGERRPFRDPITNSVLYRSVMGECSRGIRQCSGGFLPIHGVTIKLNGWAALCTNERIEYDRLVSNLQHALRSERSGLGFFFTAAISRNFYLCERLRFDPVILVPFISVMLCILSVMFEYQRAYYQAQFSAKLVWGRRTYTRARF